MAESIKNYIEQVEKNASSSEIQKIREVEYYLSKKNQLNNTIKESSREGLDRLITDLSIPAELTASLVSDQLDSSNIQTANEEILTDENSKSFFYSSVEEGDVNGNNELNNAKSVSDAYVIIKMFSLGYVPKLHEQKFPIPKIGILNPFNIHAKTSFVWSLSKYTAVGGPLTNGALNTGLNKINNTFIDLAMKAFKAEELKNITLLNSLVNYNINGDRITVNHAIQRLNEIQVAIQNNDLNKVKSLSIEYDKEFPKLRRMESIIGETNFNKDREKRKEKLLDRTISKSGIDDEIKLEIDHGTEGIKREINIIENEIYNEKRNKNDKKKISILEEKKRLLSEISNLYSKDYKNADTNGGKKIYKEQRAELRQKLDQYRTINYGEIEIHDSSRYLISFIDKLKTAFDTKNIKEIELLIREYNTVHNPRKKPILNQAFISHLDNFNTELKIAYRAGNQAEINRLLQYYNTDHNLPITNFVDRAHLEQDFGKRYTQLKKSSEIDIDKAFERKENSDRLKHQNTQIEKETERIENEILETEKRMEIKQEEAAKQIQELEEAAKRNPEKIPELRRKSEELVNKFNGEIEILEANGVSNLKKLDPKDLTHFSNKSKWTDRMIKANNGIDNLVGGKYSGKVVGVGMMCLLGKGFWDNVKDGNISTKEWQAGGDLALSMIPVLGGARDLYAAYEGKNTLTGEELSSSERWMRAGFGIVGLIPGAGWLAKGALKVAAEKGIVATTEAIAKTTHRIETGVQSVNLTGKIAGYGLLGFSLGTTTYDIGEKYLTDNENS